jgi:hypothetical protein
MARRALVTYDIAGPELSRSYESGTHQPVTGPICGLPSKRNHPSLQRP